MEREKIVLSRDDARDLLWESASEDGSFTRIANDFVDKLRWESVHRLVIQRASDSRCFATTYTQGLTEQQDTRPWEYEEQVTFTQVFPHTKISVEFKDQP